MYWRIWYSITWYSITHLASGYSTQLFLQLQSLLCRSCFLLKINVKCKNVIMPSTFIFQMSFMYRFFIHESIFCTDVLFFVSDSSEEYFLLYKNIYIQWIYAKKYYVRLFRINKLLSLQLAWVWQCITKMLFPLHQGNGGNYSQNKRKKIF